ncbi:hypothetical protein ST201phi2-1p006 [Pseudomonas phage 201phi2-1]|uniref:Uncharacterized protein n=1 Tax=Pseudomonas phage 201phi2-1 TaxID=198110 RepID=B3FJY2_BP201|nr:hypothetical protein ST201phi2-1p006 [Pseudomonas phage 201phi2-1]ABY62840.1 hypothetical protein 201phi2-1p006 [Pseudomonas phage 201phi2-1]
MKVYRFLNPNGEGLYQNDFWRQVGLPYVGEDIPFHQPPVYEDVRGWKLEDANKYICAFQSPDKLVSWFRDLNPLQVFIEGGSLVEIIVPNEHVRLGNHQCAIRKFKETSVREIGIDEFIDLIDNSVERYKELIVW